MTATRTHNIGRLSADEIARLDAVRSPRLSRPEWVMLMVQRAEREMQTRRAYSDDVPSIMEAVAPEPVEVLSNCWHCAGNSDDNSTCERREALWRGGHANEVLAEDISWWIESQVVVNDMPPRNATGCPGFEPKEDK